MDRSLSYVKMCEKAKEVQKLRPSGTDEHDYFWCPVHGLGCDLDNATWLPRQDQLQEMVIGKYRKKRRELRLVLLERDYHNYLMRTVASEILCFTSLEQFWLAFVMKEKFGKVWRDEEWGEDEQES